MTDGITGFNVELVKEEEGKLPIITIGTKKKSVSKPGWVDISGTVTNQNNTPLCTMALANGKIYVSPVNPMGKFSLTVPPG